MKHFKIGALKIAFLQIFPAKNKFENQIHIETRQKKIISDDFKLNIFENGV